MPSGGAGFDRPAEAANLRTRAGRNRTLCADWAGRRGLRQRQQRLPRPRSRGAGERGPARARTAPGAVLAARWPA